MNFDIEEYLKIIEELKFSKIISDKNIKKYLSLRLKSTKETEGIIRSTIAQNMLDFEIREYEKIGNLTFQIKDQYDLILKTVKKIKKIDNLNHFKNEVSNLKKQITLKVKTQYENHKFLNNYLSNSALIELKEIKMLLDEYILIEDALGKLKNQIDDGTLRIKKVDYKRLKHSIEANYNDLNIKALKQKKINATALSEELISLKYFEEKEIALLQEKCQKSLIKLENMKENNNLPLSISKEVEKIIKELIDLRLNIINCEPSRHIVKRIELQIYIIESKLKHLGEKNNQISRTINIFNEVLDEIKMNPKNNNLKYFKNIDSLDQNTLNKSYKEVRLAQDKILTENSDVF